MSSFTDIAAGIAEQFKLAVGDRCYGYLPGSIDPPTLFVLLDEAEPVTMGNGIFVAQFNAYFLASTADIRTGQTGMLTTASPADIWDAFGLNNDLGLTDTRATLQQIRNLSSVEFYGASFFGCLFSIRVTTPGV